MGCVGRVRKGVRFVRYAFFKIKKMHVYLIPFFERLVRFIHLKLQPVWPDLVKFHHFGKYLKIFGNIFKFYLVLGKVSNLAQFVCYWANFHNWKWPNIENTIWSSGHTGSYLHNSLHLWKLIRQTQKTDSFFLFQAALNRVNCQLYSEKFYEQKGEHDRC